MATRGSSASARSAVIVGKENICPDIRRELANTSRSPLPEGFRRAPLQDITHVLSPVNIPLNDGDSSDLGLCRPLRKRSKCLDAPSSTTSCESEPHSSAQAWRGLRKCEALEVSVRIAQAEAAVKHTKDNGVLQVEERSAKVAHVVEVAKAEPAGDLRDPAEIKSEERLQERAAILGESEPGTKLGELQFVGGLSKLKSSKRSPNSGSSSSTRSSLRSAQQKPKMSSLMKLR
ncbi:hypothetical protein GOP47_0029765 [Adiantum capillus-veneris]|nr:hypothetical protein GOP47_0029765 [Adiantum capillus-veneris]